MYLSFYGLDRKPFQNSTNPSFFWLGEMHKKALAHLKYGISQNQGFLLLTGDVGTGKTTLVNVLTNSLGDEFIVARVTDPGLELIDFMNYVSHAFDMKEKFVCKEAFLVHFDQFLNNAYAAGKKILLIIDECQRLSSELLEEIRQLSNIEKQESKLLNIFFVGQNVFNDILKESNNRALLERISITSTINSLDVYETGEFIRHRLKIAGTEKEIFSQDAIRLIYEFSGGFPRGINTICDHALTSGFIQRTKIISFDMVRKCAKDLRLPFSYEITNSWRQVAVDIPDFENPRTLPPDRWRESKSTHGRRAVIASLLIAMVVIIITLIIDPSGAEDFFCGMTTNGKQIFSFLWNKNAPNATHIHLPNKHMDFSLPFAEHKLTSLDVSKKVQTVPKPVVTAKAVLGLDEPANPLEAEKGYNEDTENMDPGAVIDWVMKNRSKRTVGK